MKVAIVHDYLKEFGGAEKVLETLLEIWPDADVYTSVFLPEYSGPHKSRLEKWKVHTSILQIVPLKAKLISMFRFVAPLVFRSFNLSDYDLVITSTAGTYTSPNFVKVGKTQLICYCHTPPRYLYGYPTANDWTDSWWRKILLKLGQIPMYFLRKLDYMAAQLPDYYIANSKEVAGRIKKFYKRDSFVIYPPVEIPDMSQADKEDGGYYLAGGRLARAKRVDLAIKACNKLKLNLKVFGRGFGGNEKYIKSIIGPTVEYLGELTEKEKWDLYKNATAFIYPSEKEDFGIQPVEAMAVGTPVIAYKSGGTKESVIDGKTGIFFNKETTKAVIDAINKFKKTKLNPKDCIAQAKKFSKERFKKEIVEIINEYGNA